MGVDTVREVPAVRFRNADMPLRAAFLVSSTGDWVYRLAVPLLVLQLTGSALSTAFAYALEFIPYIGLGLFAGVFADRWNRRRTLIGCDTLSAIVAAALALVASTDHPPIGVLYVLAFVLACIRPFYFPAFHGLLVDVVDRDRLPLVNSWTQTVDSTLGMFGPVAGAALVAAMGAASATALNGASFAASALLVSGLGYQRPQRDRAGAPGVSGLGADFVVGLRALTAVRSMVWGTGLMAASNLALNIVEGNLFYLVLHVERLSKLALGTVFSAQGLGAVVGAVLAPRLIRRYATGRLLTAGMGLSALCLALPAVVPAWGALVAAWGFQGIATSVMIVSWVTARQRLIPAHVMGRVVSVGRALAFTTIPVGALIGGWVVGDAHAMRVLFACAASIQVLVLVGTATSPLARIDGEIEAGLAGRP